MHRSGGAPLCCLSFPETVFLWLLKMRIQSDRASQSWWLFSLCCLELVLLCALKSSAVFS